MQAEQTHIEDASDEKINHERRAPFIKTRLFSNAKQKMQENFPNLGPFLV